ncbi:MAG: leucine-rich repeat domain-containing protein, partial [Oscillospiraceae bacterium]|nr:leucine-rich repeat domain-containing protein [Oscillospiraceae bacterium]
PEEALERMTRDIRNALGITSPPAEVPEEPAVPTEPNEEQPKKKAKKEKTKKTRTGRKKKLPWLLGILALAVILAAALLLAKRPVGNTDVDKNAFSVTLEGALVTQKDMNAFSKFVSPGVIRLQNCTIEAQDLSPLSIGSVLTLELSGCNLTDAQLATIDFSAFDSLSQLAISGNPGLTCIGGADVCAETLTELDISDTGIREFDWLADFTKLEELRADRTELSDTAPLEAMIYLEELSLSGNGITSLDGLKNTSKLTEVDLSRNSLTDVSVLSRSVATLTSLDLRGNAIADLSCLTDATLLKKVRVDENELASLEWLKNCSELAYFTASHNRIESIAALGIGEAMRLLDLSCNQLQRIDSGDIVFGADTYVTVDLSGNALQTVDLPQTCIYKQLALLGNPELELSCLQSLSGWDLYLDFPADVALEDLTALQFDSLRIVGCPLDRQVELEEGLSGEVLMTEEEALEAIENTEVTEIY